MRIAFFTTDFPATYEPEIIGVEAPWWGGVGLANLELATRMAHRGFDIEVYTSGPGRAETTRFDGHLRIHRVPVTYTFSQTGISVPLLIALPKSKPDLVHAHRGSPPGAFGGWLAARRLHVPLVTTYHGDLFTQRRDPLTAILLKMFLPLQSRILGDSKQIITVSRSIKENSLALRRWKSKVTVIPNGVVRPLSNPNLERTPARKRLQIPGTSKVCISIGAINFRKGYDVLLRAISAIEGPARPLVALIGHSANAQALRREIRALGVTENVRSEGFVSEERKADYLSAADVLVLPSRLEGLPLVVLEAFSHGVPVIASDLPVFREIINHGENGLLVEPANPRALAAAILNALGDDSWLSHARGQAQQTAKRFDWEAVVDETEKIYDRAITNDPKAPL